MKTILVTVSLALAGVSTSQAQVFRPSVATGAVVGAVAGGLIGNNNGNHAAAGAVLGAATGALIGAAVSPPPAVYQAPVYGQQVYGQQGEPVYAQTQTVPNGQVVQNAPTVGQSPQIVDVSPQVVQVQPQVVQTSPQVVYVERAPQVVYVPAPRVVYGPPVVSFGFGIYSGPRYYGPVYRGGYRYAHGHR